MNKITVYFIVSITYHTNFRMNFEWFNIKESSNIVKLRKFGLTDVDEQEPKVRVEQKIKLL